MTSSKLTAIEEEMFAKGYVSSRMAAYKLRKSIQTVLRRVREGAFTAVRIGTQQLFIEVESIVEFYGEEASALLELDDWDCVFEMLEDGEVHVKKQPTGE
jgi:hypothetical protein